MSSTSFLPARTNPFDPPGILRQLRREPISKVTLWNGDDVWLVTRYRDACAVLRDHRFSSDSTNPKMPLITPGHRYSTGLAHIGGLDDPKHAELRQAIANEFTARSVARLHPVIQRVVDAQLVRMLASDPPVDFIATVASEVAGQVIAHMLGIPEPDVPLFQESAWTLISFAATQEQVTQAGNTAIEYIEHLVAEREQQPTADLIGRMAASGRFTHAELVHNAWFLALAGHVGTMSTMGMSVLTLLMDRTLFDALRDHPELVPGAVDELLRYHSVQTVLRRVAVEDVTVAGTVIRAGQGVLVQVASANRDDHAFHKPDRLDIRRDARQHLAFGRGAHVCLGQTVARAELQALLSAVTRTIPSLQVAVPFDHLRFQNDRQTYGVCELPVTW